MKQEDSLKNTLKITTRRWLFGLILAGGTLLRLWNLGAFGVQHDAGLYAVRALGWFDFLSGVGQSSPIVWFDSIPGWANLSFHDHPPLGFAVMHVFMRLFGQSSFVVLLPFAAAGVGCMVLIYILLRRSGGDTRALLGLAFLGVSSYAVWGSRVGYLEGIEVFFIAASVYFFGVYALKHKTSYLFWWAVSVGLALLSKYTAIFLLPAVFVYLLIWDRKTFKTGNFWLALLLIPVLLTPVIIYNVKLFQTRGHFDAALSSMVGMHPQDYEVISKRGLNVNFQNNFLSVFSSLRANGSLPFFGLELAAIAYTLLVIIRRRAEAVWKFAFVNFLFILVMFLFAGGGSRFLSIVTPFIALMMAYSVYDWYRLLTPYRTWRNVWSAALVVIMGAELLYAINTNVLYLPYGKEGITYSPTRLIDNGFAELDRFLKANALGTLPPRRRVATFKDLVQGKVSGTSMVIFDGRADWFSTMWHVNRYYFYYRAPIVHFPDFLLFGQNEAKEDQFTYLTRRGFRNFWFVQTMTDGIPGDPGNDEYQNSIRTLVRSLEEGGVKPVKEIYSGRGKLIFRIYRFSTSA